MAHPASRVLALLELLQAHRRMTGPDLAARLGVDERTVRRYAGTLAELGIPVTAERGRYGGYSLLAGFKLPPLMLTDDEAVAVMLGLIAAERLGLTAETPAAAAAEAKIQRVLPVSLTSRLAALRDSLGLTARVRRRPEGRPPETDTLLTLGAATGAGETLDLRYRTADGEDSERHFDPYGVVFHAGRWYAVGHDHRSGETRSLRADRITTAVATGRRFAPPGDFDAVAHLNRQFAALPWGWEVEVLVEASVEDLRRRVPPDMAEIAAEPGGRVRMRFNAHRLDGTAHMLAGLGRPFEVVAPAELRSEVARYAARLATWARRGDTEFPDAVRGNAP